MKKSQAFLIFLLVIFAAASGWASQIFVSIPPQKWLADQLTADQETVHVLIGTGQDPHTFEPTPSQMVKLAKADLFFTLGMEFEHQLITRLRKNSLNITFIDLSENVEKLAMAEERELDEDHEHHHRAASDPHIWLDPDNLRTMAQTMTRALIAASPGNDKLYSKKLNDLLVRLDSLDNRLRQKLSPYAGQTFYVFHPSFGYFAKAYGLTQRAVEVSGKQPSPKQLSRLITLARSEGVQVIFSQPQFDPRSAQAVAGSIGGKVVALDALAEDVEDNLILMAQTIAEALSGKGAQP